MWFVNGMVKKFGDVVSQPLVVLFVGRFVWLWLSKVWCPKSFLLVPILLSNKFFPFLKKLKIT
jgi:hypothetical protein